MPGFRGIRMVSFDKNQQPIIVRAPQGAEPITYSVWPERAVSTLVDIMVHFYAPILNEKVQSQKEAYYQKAFDAFAFHLIRLEKENLLPAEFLGNLTKQEMFLKWQEIENKYNELAISQVSGRDGSPGQQAWPYFDKMTFILKNERNKPPNTQQQQQQSSSSSSSSSHTQYTIEQEQQQQATSSSFVIDTNNQPIPTSTPTAPDNVTSPVVEQPSEEQRIISHIVDESVSRVMEELKTDQEHIQQYNTFKEQSKHAFRNELLGLMRRRVELLEEQRVRQEEDRVERRIISERLAIILDKLADKTLNHQQ
ncbi:hypothetical protein G6F56_012012 [Rhizopus delemar]|nr:hypothetical protein G6F56_012012 [Rhizopus delemar]